MPNAEPQPREHEPPPDSPPPRPARRLEIWFDLLDRLAERKKNYDQKNAQPAAPSRAQLFLDNAVWNLLLFARWLRPRLKRRARATGRGAKLQAIRSSRQISRNGKRIGHRLLGWLLWQIRQVRINPERRLAALALVGGFAIPLALIITLAHVLPMDSTSPEAQPYIDPSVPVPSAEFSETEEEGTSPTETADNKPVAQPQAPQGKAITSNNFRFEYFVQRDARGRIHLLGDMAETTLLTLFPLGTPAVRLMRFFGEVMVNSGSDHDEATLAAKARCMSMPMNKIFTSKTVTCTYGHILPGPYLPNENMRRRIFWIMALTYDRGGHLTDLRVHARTTLASR